MRIDRFLYFALLLFLPTQLTKFYFFDSLLITGLQVDYVALSINATQLILLLLIIFLVKKQGSSFLNTLLKNRLLLLFVLLLFISITLSLYPLAGVIKLLPLFGLIFLGLYIIIQKPSFVVTVTILTISTFLSSLLAITQFYLQRSVGGIPFFLGERTFTIATPGIAKSVIHGIVILRPYATLPHPNVLAGQIALLLPFIVYCFYMQRGNNWKIIYLTIYCVFLSALILTMSRATIIASYLAVFTTSVWVLNKHKKKLKSIMLAVSIFSTILIFPISLYRFESLFNLNDSSIVERLSLVKASSRILFNNSLFGVGLNNFIFYLPTTLKNTSTTPLLQPVHNTYLLVLVELGLVGLFFLMYLLLLCYKRTLIKKFPTNMLFFITLMQVIIILSIDHYLYTLWQGQLLFTILIAFMISKETRYE